MKKSDVVYEKHIRVRKPVSFHALNDAELIEFANTLNFSVWVKEQLKIKLKESKND